MLLFYNTTYLWNQTTRANGVSHAHRHVVRILSPPDKELVSHIVGPVIDHETATLDPTWVAAAEVDGHVGAVTAALIRAALEVPFLIEDNLQEFQKDL